MESCQHPLKSAMRICMIFVLWSITLGWPQEMPPDIRDSKYYTLANIYYGWRLLYPVLFIFRLVQSKIRHWLGFKTGVTYLNHCSLIQADEKLFPFLDLCKVYPAWQWSFVNTNRNQQCTFVWYLCCGALRLDGQRPPDIRNSKYSQVPIKEVCGI